MAALAKSKKPSLPSKWKGAAISALGSVPMKGIIKKGAQALNKASKAAKKKVNNTKKKVVASLKTQKKTVKKKIGKIVKKRGKVFTKARKLLNNLTKKERINNLKKAMNKAVLAVKSIPIKGKSSPLRNETLAGNHSNIKMGKHGVDWEYYERIAREQGIDKVPKEIRSEITGNARIDKQADSTMADFLPFISTVKGIQQAITGEDWILNQKLSKKEQIAEVGGALASASLIPGAKKVGEYATKGIMKGGEFVADVITNFANKTKGKVDEIPSKSNNPSKGIDNAAHNATQYQKLKEQLALDEIQSVVNTTKHGAERLIERGFTPKDISDLKLRPDIIKTQSDGAQVFIKQVNGKYNVIVEGDNGVITSLKNISENSLNRLSDNYGWR